MRLVKVALSLINKVVKVKRAGCRAIIKGKCSGEIGYV